MAILKRKPQKRSSAGLFLTVGDAIDCGYRPLTEEPTIATACERVADIVGQVTWHIMSNTENGDIRIINELSRKIDINPNKYLTRQKFIEFVVNTLLLYGNAIVLVMTEGGYLRDLVPMPHSRVNFLPDVNGYGY